jgi:ferritin
MDITQQILKPQTLSGDVVTLLTERLGDEYTAHYFYRNASNWCEEKGYLKAAAFFEKEAKDELKHAQKVQKYLVDWNIVPTIPAVNMQPAFNSLVDIVNKAYQLEYNLFLQYNANSAEIFPGDIATFDFLQELRIGQTQSVAEYATLLNGAELVDISNKLDVLYYENQYFG